MKDLKTELFQANHDKMTEKAFSQSIAISVIGIIICMIALCSTTWAWFKADISSNSNNIQSAYCNVTISVANSGTTIDPVDNKYSFEKDKVYEIKIIASGTAESAYCILNINGTLCYTDRISTESENNTMSFKLRFTNDTKVAVITGWGTSSQSVYFFEDGLCYLDLAVTDPTTIAAAPAKADPAKTPETTGTAPASNSPEGSK